jgi:glycosyltransferase involved in cell wall biosynthesis
LTFQTVVATLSKKVMNGQSPLRLQEREMGIVIGIDASRNRSGGAKAHLVGILKDGDPLAHGISKVHVWSYKTLLDALPDVPWLVKHNPPELERSLVYQVWWQYRSLPNEALRNECDILLNTDAGSVCGFCPAVVMSRDMLSYEPQEMRRYGISAMRLRLILLRVIQTRSMKRADGVIFLTNYAARVIQGATGELRRLSVIPHGIGAAFKQTTTAGVWSEEPSRKIRCLYVSNTAMYKHQWVVVRAIGQLRRRGHNISLLLAGGGSGRAQRLLGEEIARTDPQGDFIKSIGFVRHDEVPILLSKADLFIFASSCENMPNTLVEAMASGLPIACSDRGPMPEILKDGGVYFDPESSDSIFAAIEAIILNREMRISTAKRAKELSEQYSWARCASETWDFLSASTCM